ncbi:unnamed protein product [Linum trigynum]|uniref:BHLH domain-containing protein n=1 Tax=Linum trigynum TaxID=586398 RepID=A0AAV2C6P8_9ROSI
MLAMSSTSSSSHQPTNPFLASNLGGGLSSSSSPSPWPLLLEDPLTTLLPNYHNHHNLLSTHFLPPQASADANYSSHRHDGNYHHQSFTGEDQEHAAVTKKDSSSSGGDGGGTVVVTAMKKLNHNASERHRRKKINTLYSSLRSMLPPSDYHDTKKLSIPNTVSRVLKYIPELQQQVEALARKKEDLLSAISNNTTTTITSQVDIKQDCADDVHHIDLDKTNKKSYKMFSSSSSSSLASSSSSSTASTSWLSEEEVMVQISIAAKSSNNTLDHISGILLHLQEETGLVLVNSSSFKSFQGRVFYNLHLKVNFELQSLLLFLPVRSLPSFFFLFVFFGE